MSEGDGKTEVEFAGVKFRGGKIFVIITPLSTLGGGLYAGFEFYKDYTDMKEQIQSYVAPDLSGVDKKVAVFAAENLTIRQTMEQQVKIIEKLSTDMYKIEERIDKKITKALENPLNY